MRRHLLPILLGLSMTFSIPFISASQSLFEVSINEKVEHSTLIIEGKVVQQESFWNNTRSMIYTSNKIEVYKIFKGSYQPAFLEIITQGGSVGHESIEASDLLALAPHEVGVFFCYPNSINMRSSITGERYWDVYSSSQGFFSYDLDNQTASAPFVRYQDITTSLYGELRIKTGRNFENRKPEFSVKDLIPSGNRASAPVISGFSPANVTAGATLDPTTNLLTINGSGFGTASGTAAILFDDANNGTGGTAYTVAYNDPLVISWADAQIQVRVPSRAGTGSFSVRDAAGVSGVSPGNLTVLYSILTTTFNISGTLYTKESNLMSDNGAGGYSILYSTSTLGGGVDINASVAKETFVRALNTWKETVGLNVFEAGTTATQQINPSDGLNVIMFDNTNTGNAPLAAGVLGVCYSFNSICTSSPATNQAQKTEFDIVIRNTGVSTGTTAFTNGPCPPNSTDYTQIDLETVLLHELGHALNLGHINDGFQGGTIGYINPNKLMHYAVVNSVKRVTPDYSAYAGALYAVTPQGNTYGACLAPAEMTQLSITTESKDECPLSFPTTPGAMGSIVNFDLAHATSNRLVDPAYTQVRCDGLGTSITNNAYYAFKTSATGGTLTINVSGYATTPPALASCTQIYAGVPVTGFRFSLYQVNSCPAAGAFPAPVNCQTFSGNGPLTTVAGLAANTTYLMYVEGIENTKGSFSFMLGGTTLPIKFSSFTGKAVSDYNQLNWTIEYSYQVKELQLQRSADGISFETIGKWDGNNLSQVGEFNDRRPFSGNNFYRLATVNMDGSIEYSQIVHLKRNDKFLVSVYPNPARTTLGIELNTGESGVYEFVLYNSSGQVVKQQAYVVTAPRQNIVLKVSELSAGSYFLKIMDKEKKVLKSIPVAIE